MPTETQRNIVSANILAVVTNSNHADKIFINLKSITDMKREEILSAIRRNVVRSGGVCFPKNFWMNIDGNVKVDYVEADRVVFEDDYCTFDEFSDEELELVLNAVAIDYSKTSTEDLFAMVNEVCDMVILLDNIKVYMGEDKIREFLMACLGKSVE